MSKIYLKIAIFVFIFIIAWFIGFILFTNSIFSYSTPKILDNSPNTGITVLTGGRNRIANAIDLLNNKKGTR